MPLCHRVVIGPPQRLRGRAREIAASLEEMVRDLAASEAATRHKRTYRPRRALSLAVLGIDGSGKSTVSGLLATSLSKNRRVCRIGDGLEIVDRGESRRVRALPMESARQAVARVARHARSLESYKIPKLTELLMRDHLLEEVRRWHAPEVIVLDGSPLLNLLAWARLYAGDRIDANVLASAVRVVTRQREPSRSEAAFAALPELVVLDRLRLARLHLPDAAILLDLEPATAVKRVQARGAASQAHETEIRLERLRESYLLVCEVVRLEFAVPICRVPASADSGEVAARAAAFAGEMLSRVQGAT